MQSSRHPSEHPHAEMLASALGNGQRHGHAIVVPRLFAAVRTVGGTDQFFATDRVIAAWRVVYLAAGDRLDTFITY